MLSSISKTITATALMQLYEQGKFDLDEDINNYLDFRVYNPTYQWDPISFRMLLAHQSSLRDRVKIVIRKYPGEPEFIKNLYPWLIDIILPTGKNYSDIIWMNNNRPGEKYYYSNVGYALIGYLVERISGLKFDEYCRNNIFEPLGMYNTSFSLHDLDIDKIAIPYELHPKNFQFGKLVPYEHYGMLGYPCSSVRSDIIDFSRFIIAHMNDGEFNGVRILNKSTVDLMHSVQYPDSWSTNDFRFYQYGLGWIIWEDIQNETFIGHTGHTTTASSRVKVRLSDNVAIFYFINRCVNKRIRGALSEHFIEWALFNKAGAL
jgi:CubicO group peptidase (beta-lactamase class C family)